MNFNPEELPGWDEHMADHLKDVPRDTDPERDETLSLAEWAFGAAMVVFLVMLCFAVALWTILTSSPA